MCDHRERQPGLGNTWQFLTQILKESREVSNLISHEILQQTFMQIQPIFISIIICQALFTGNTIVKYDRYRLYPYEIYVLSPNKVYIQKEKDIIQITIEDKLYYKCYTGHKKKL